MMRSIGVRLGDKLYPIRESWTPQNLGRSFSRPGASLVRAQNARLQPTCPNRDSVSETATRLRRPNDTAACTGYFVTAV